jgi:hypothetical protein
MPRSNYEEFRASLDLSNSQKLSSSTKSTTTRPSSANDKPLIATARSKDKAPNWSLIGASPISRLV